LEKLKTLSLCAIGQLEEAVVLALFLSASQMSQRLVNKRKEFWVSINREVISSWKNELMSSLQMTIKRELVKKVYSPINETR